MNNVLIVGSGAAAYALAKKIYNQNESCKIYIASNSLVKSDKYECIDIRAQDLTGLLKFAIDNDIDITIPVSQDAICADIVSFFQANGQNIFGPAKQAANIAINKAAGKKFLYKIHAQTSKFGVFDKIQQAQEWLGSANFPVTIRSCIENKQADRLVCPTKSLANEFLDGLFSKGETGVLAEEFTFGHNFTVYYIADGYSALPLCSVGNYKFEKDGDGGYLTNGVGCFCPDYKITDVIQTRVSNIVKNVLALIEKNGDPYVGILGIDCTVTGEDKFFINEFRSFLQDYDAAAVLNLIDQDILRFFHACIEGYFSDDYHQIEISHNSCVSALVKSRKPCELINGLDLVENIDDIDFISVKQAEDGGIYTLSDECFVITRCASTLSRARQYLYEDLSVISFEGMKYRKDICKCD